MANNYLLIFVYSRDCQSQGRGMSATTSTCTTARHARTRGARSRSSTSIRRRLVGSCWHPWTKKNHNKASPTKKTTKKILEMVCKIVDIEVRKPSKCVLCWNTSDQTSDQRSNIRTPFASFKIIVKIVCTYLWTYF